MRVIRCDCGFEATGDGDELVTLAQSHAREIHDVEVPAELLGLAPTKEQPPQE